MQPPRPFARRLKIYGQDYRLMRMLSGSHRGRSLLRSAAARSEESSEDTAHTTVGRSTTTGEEGTCCETQSTSSGPQLSSRQPMVSLEADIASLVEDRLDCIRPGILAEIQHALGMAAPPIVHPQVLRRNVAAHARGFYAARRISLLSLRELRVAQKTGSTSDIMLEWLVQRIEALEAKFAATDLGTDEHSTPGTDALNEQFLDVLTCAQSHTQALVKHAPGSWSNLGVDAKPFVPAAAHAVADAEVADHYFIGSDSEDVGSLPASAVADSEAVAWVRWADQETSEAEDVEDAEGHFHEPGSMNNMTLYGVNSLASDPAGKYFVVEQPSVAEHPDELKQHDEQANRKRNNKESVETWRTVSRKRGKGKSTFDQELGDRKNASGSQQLGKGRTATLHTKAAHRLRSHEDIHNFLHNMLGRAIQVLQAKRPRRHADYKVVKGAMQDVIGLCPEQCDVRDIAEAVLDRLVTV